MNKVFDFHIHSIYSDGELIPAEIVQRCSVLNHEAIAIADHVDNSNIEFVVKGVVRACEEMGKHTELELFPGAEITHVSLEMIPSLIKKAKKLGARVIIVHGETLVEPVVKGTNLAALKIPEVNILAHPGLITIEEAELAKENNIFLELTARKGHCFSNGHIAKVAMEVGNKLLVNSDAHSPLDLLNEEKAFQVAFGSGLSEKNSKIVTRVNPKDFIGSI